MTENQSRKHANTPDGYKAVYGQNQIVYKQFRNSRQSHKTPWLWIALMAALVIVVAVAIAHQYGFITLWEDGSFRLFNLTGCIPFQLCQ